MEVTTITKLESTPEYIFLNSLFLYIMQWQAMDKLKGTPYYRNDVKQACANAIRVMTCAFEQQVRNLNSTPEQVRIKDAMILLVRELSAEIITMSTEYFGVVAEVIKFVKTDPDGVMELLSIYFEDAVKVEEVAA